MQDGKRPTDDAHVPFVSRSAPTNKSAPAAELRCKDGSPLPGLRDRSVQALLLLVVVLQAASWWILEGYQLADSVEYMERAQSFARNVDVIDEAGLRSFGFTGLFVPIFWLADLFELENYRPIVSLIRCLQMGLGLALVYVCMRIGARLGNRRMGLVAGYFTGVNPVFLQYAVSPVSDIAAGVCVGAALYCLLERAGPRRSFAGGVWLGLALIMSYKTVTIIVPILVMVFVRDRFRFPRSWAAILGGLAIPTVFQISVDKWIYDYWGISLIEYFLANMGGMLTRVFLWSGMDDWAEAIYKTTLDIVTIGGSAGTIGDADQPWRQKQPPHYYFSSLPLMLVWPIIVCWVLGLARAIVRGSWQTTVLLLVFIGGLGLTSLKGSKDFRLWLPLMAMITPLCAAGFEAIRTPREGDPRFWRKATTFVILIGALVLGMQTLLRRNTLKFSGYWSAMDDIIAEVAATRGPDDPKLRVSSAYHWAVYLRESADIELIKLPYQLDQWSYYTAQYSADPNADPEEQDLRRLMDLEEIASLDWFITHLAVLSKPEHREIMEAVNRDFEIHSMYWDYRNFEDIGPVFLLKRRTGNPEAKTFFERIEGVDPEAYRRAHLLPPSQRFLRKLGDHMERVTLLGFEYEELRGDDHGWITYHWLAESTMLGDYTVVDRLTTYDERNTWQNNHAPAYGVYKTVDWQPGWIIRESWPVVAAEEPDDWRARFRPMGGPYRRGDFMPGNLWIDLATFGEGGELTGRMEPAHDHTDTLIRDGEWKNKHTTRDGYVFSKDGLIRVGRFFLPVHWSARVPDDGRPIAD